MHRGGSGLRRCIRRFAVLAATGAILLPNGPTATAVSNGPSIANQGDAGTGIPDLPVVRHDGDAMTARRTFRWSDLDPSDAWAKTAIDYVGKTHDWMRDFAAKADGTVPFKPDTIETRKYFARAVVKAFAPHAVVDPSITFPDLDPTQTFYKWANIAVQQGWMKRLSDGRFAPDRAVTMVTVHRVLVLALGLRATAARIDRLHTHDGTKFDTQPNLGTTMLGMRLGLRYPSSDASHDVTPHKAMPRAQVAYSLYRAKTQASWVVPWLRDQYSNVALPNLGPTRRAIVQWGLGYVGYPYVWAGEWGFDSPEPAGLGGQPIAGFDCSGLAWWLLREDDGGAWNITPPRPYRAWPLPQRTSADMAKFGVITWKNLMPGDLAFYDGDGNGTVDHVDVYVGNGFALDSSTSVGTTLMYVADGWYRDHFVHGRRLIPTK